MTLHCFTQQFLYTVDPKLPKLILDEMFNQCKAFQYVTSTTYRPEGQDMRSSKQHWLEWDTWIAGIINNIFISANNDYFHYDLDHFDSGLQITKYDVGDYYDWHTDMLTVESLQNYSRKLSMSMLLNDEFEGGELEIAHTQTNESFTVDLKAGTCAIFPAWVKHRVKPVTSGTRYSIVAWMNGPQLK